MTFYPEIVKCMTGSIGNQPGADNLRPEFTDQCYDVIDAPVAIPRGGVYAYIGHTGKITWATAFDIRPPM